MTAHRAGNSRHRRPSCRPEIPIQRQVSGIRVLAGTGEARRTAIPARAAPDRGHCADPVHPDTPNPPASPDPPPKAASESDIRDIRDKLPLYAAEGGQAEGG